MAALHSIQRMNALMAFWAESVGKRENLSSVFLTAARQRLRHSAHDDAAALYNKKRKRIENALMQDAEINQHKGFRRDALFPLLNIRITNLFTLIVV